MRAWTSPDLPDLAAAGLGTGPAVRVRDTRTGQLAEVDPPERARLYVCGITPYDATHLGHAATYLAFDLLQRAWRDRGLAVTYTQNVTDVDDPLLERAASTGVDWTVLARDQIELFRADMTALRMITPDHYVGAVESMPLVAALVERLRELGAVYDVDGDLYFSVTSDPSFGDVSGLDRDEMLALFGDRGGDPDRAGKRDPLDCLVWQAPRDGEPSWDSPFGPGRPGWHVECAAMAREYLGADFDVQGGGSDLVFPHHEMSAAEAQVAHHGERFARTYLHQGMVGFEGEKMSKSKGNLVLVSALRGDGHDPMAIRLALLAHHYRSDWEWTDKDLDAATARLQAWRTAFETVGPAAGPVVTALRGALADDLDAPRALEVVDAWAASTQGGGGSSDELLAPAAAKAGGGVALAVDALLGIR